MSAVIIRPRERVEVVRYELVLDRIGDEHGGGYAFDCNADGSLVVMGSETVEQRQARIDAIVAEGLHTAPRVARRSHSYIEPAVARCNCGAEVCLADPLDNECERCGRWFNCCGQEVVNPNSELGRALRDEDDRYADDDGARW
jgi:hypothetical protein